MKALDSAGITFVNAVLGRGVLNNVVNIQLGAYQFSADEEKGAVDPDMVVVARLRMDRACAKQLHDTLGSLLTSIEEAEADAALPAGPGVATAPESLN